MRTTWLLTILMLVVISSSVYGQATVPEVNATPAATAPVETKDQVIGEIEKLGGEVRMNEQAADKPVIAVDFNGKQIKDTDLALLEGLNHLQTLSLVDTPVTDAGLEHIKGLSELQTLNLRGTKIRDDGLAFVEGMSELRFLSLFATNVTDAGLAHLSGLTQLRQLNLRGTKITDAGLEQIQGLTQLQILVLRSTKVGDAGLAYVEGLKQLRTLDLMNTSVTDAGLAHIKELSQLQTLDLRDTQITDNGVDQLTGLSHLKTLEVKGSKVTQEALSRLMPGGRGGQGPLPATPAPTVPKVANAAPAPPPRPVQAMKPNAAGPGIIGQLIHSPAITFFIMFAAVIVLIVGLRIAVALKLIPAPSRGGMGMAAQMLQSSTGPVPDSCPGVTCVELDGLTVITVKPNPGILMIAALLPLLIFMGIVVPTFHIGRGNAAVLWLPLGFFLIPATASLYFTFLKNDMFVVTADSLEKRWSCKPFYWRSHFPRNEIAAVSTESVVVQGKNSSTKWVIEMTKTDGQKVRLIDGGSQTRLAVACRDLNKALFPQTVSSA